MARQMLIDATHAEETRVVVVDGSRIDEFDFESANRRQLAGNIYLAKVMRVEPSLQAAFVDYGGNRHGFLAFSEIHPDYYQISAKEREALLAAQAKRNRDANEDRDEEAEEAKPARKSRGGQRHVRRGSRDRRGSGGASRKRNSDGHLIEREFRIGGGVRVRLVNDADFADPKLLEREFALDGGIGVKLLKYETDDASDAPSSAKAATADLVERVTSDDSDATESVGGGDSWDDEPVPRPSMRDYKIQDVIKRRQILLIQIVKEERGTKGAAVTTYLSLPGRYCVLMPNTAKGGGISRKITNAPDRKRLKEIAGEMEVPRGMGLIVRTAGAQRTKSEIKRDYEYLLRQWDSVRTLTLKSYAPALIYEEGSLIKRSIRDLYSKEISEVLVEGENGYREAKEYMKMLMPSHAKHVQHYTERTPLFIRHQVENQLSAMFNPVVQLKSGGYIVIGITEALVAIDVNSGRSTRESSIEETAFKTNLEAAEEAARQMRLRDLAGLIVIDFIDMYERRNNAAVEKRLKDKLSNDRARIQIGRISSFGLLEMSRQRLRPGMLEATTTPCAHCHGTGLVRSEDTMALTILREMEEQCLRGDPALITASAPVAVSNFLLNRKRDRIVEIEGRYGVRIMVEGDPARLSTDFELKTLKDDELPEDLRPAKPVISLESGFEDVDDAVDDDEDEVAAAEAAETDDVVEQPTSDASDEAETRGGGRRRSRRGGKRNRQSDPARETAKDPLAVIDVSDDSDVEKPFNYADDQRSKPNERGGSRRSRRGGRGRGRDRNAAPREFAESAAWSMLKRNDALDRALPNLFLDSEIVFEAAKADPEPEEPEAPKRSSARRGRRKSVKNQTEAQPDPAPDSAAEIDDPAPEAAQPEADSHDTEVTATEPNGTAAEMITPEPEPQPQPEPEPEPVQVVEATPPPPPPSPARPKRKGWWSTQ